MSGTDSDSLEEVGTVFGNATTHIIKVIKAPRASKELPAPPPGGLERED